MSTELLTSVRRLPLDFPSREDVREVSEVDTVEWSFDAVFERACTNVQATFRDERKLDGHLIVGLKDGPIVVMPFSWTNDGEKALVYERLWRHYQGRAEFYVHATESSSDAPVPRGSNAEPARTILVVGVDRRRMTLARCWEIRQIPILHLVEQDEPFRQEEMLPDILFSAHVALDAMPSVITKASRS